MNAARGSFRFCPSSSRLIPSCSPLSPPPLLSHAPTHTQPTHTGPCRTISSASCASVLPARRPRRHSDRRRCPRRWRRRRRRAPRRSVGGTGRGRRGGRGGRCRTRDCRDQHTPRKQDEPCERSGNRRRRGWGGCGAGERGRGGGEGYGRDAGFQVAVIEESRPPAFIW